jgi:hypothetical protein
MTKLKFLQYYFTGFGYSLLELYFILSFDKFRRKMYHDVFVNYEILALGELI